MKQNKSKSKTQDDRGVSPVIGVILMVAITVILSAVIAAFVLDLGSSQEANPEAGVQFESINGGDDVRVTVTSVSRADSLTVRCEDDSGNEYSNAFSDPASVGDSHDVSVTNAPDAGTPGCSGETIQIIGSYNGNDAVLTTYDGHTS